MRVTVTKKAYFGGRRLDEGTVIDYPAKTAKDLPSWAVPEGTTVKAKNPVRTPGKQPKTIHEMAGEKQSVQAKTNIKEKRMVEAPQSKVVSTKGNTAKADAAPASEGGEDDITS